MKLNIYVLCVVLKIRIAFEKLLAENMLYIDYFNETEENGHKRVEPQPFYG